MKPIHMVSIGLLLTNLILTPIIAQKQTPRYQSIIANSNAFYEYLPQGYETETQSYPLLVFLHGLGELGDGSSSSLPTVLRNGPPRLINDGSFPVSFTVNGEVFKFIVISPQFQNWPVADDVQGVIDYAVKNYRVNTDRIYVTGLSMGGGVTWDYGTINLAYANRVAAIVPVCGASSSTPDKVKVVVTSNLPVWATHNQNDPAVPTSNTVNFVNEINSYTPSPIIPAKKTIFPVDGHDAWTTSYSPNFRENNLNIYEWMLQYKRGAGQLPKNTLPVPSLPGKVEAENYTIMRGVETENTNDAGGGKDIGFIDTNDWLDYEVDVTNAGSYQFNVRVAGSQAGQVQLLNANGNLLTTLDIPSTGDYQNWKTINGKVDLPRGRQTLRVSVSKGGWNLNWLEFLFSSQEIPVPGGAAIPGRIQAEKYDVMSGIGTETSNDEDGSQNVGWVSTGDWMDYKTNVSSAGNYTATFRIATAFAGQQVQIKNAVGVVLASLSLPKTGGYQVWSAATVTVSLPAGNQTLRIYSSNGSFNLNWIEFALATASNTASVATSAVATAAPKAKTAFVIYPNPVREQFSLQLDNQQGGTVDIKIADQSGSIVKSLKFEKNQQVSQLTIPANDLAPGVYYLKVTQGAWTESRKLIKM